jgi:hypothetical protein
VVNKGSVHSIRAEHDTNVFGTEAIVSEQLLVVGRGRPVPPQAVPLVSVERVHVEEAPVEMNERNWRHH